VSEPNPFPSIPITEDKILEQVGGRTFQRARTYAAKGMVVRYQYDAAANDLLTLFVALEIFSLPLYLLSGMARRRRWLSQEAALKYFLLGAFSSAFFLFGVALLYGYAGTFSYAGVAQAIVTDESPPVLLLAGLVMLAVGLLFKVGAVPFHTWTPDVYTGAPTPHPSPPTPSGPYRPHHGSPEPSFSPSSGLPDTVPSIALA